MTYLELDLKINGTLIKAVEVFLQGIANQLENDLAIQHLSEEIDPEMAATWTSGLLEHLNADTQVLFSTFGDERFGREKIALSLTDAEAILRAATAMRLKIRELQLSEISDETLEAGKLNIEELIPKVQRAYACYVFLGTLQGIIISAIDPSITAD
jgi:hypothetical protein